MGLDDIWLCSDTYVGISKTQVVQSISQNAVENEPSTTDSLPLIALSIYKVIKLTILTI